MAYYRSLKLNSDKELQSYAIGLAVGDGNLSNPNGRATRLRITCDLKYPRLIKRIIKSLESLFPENKVGVQKTNGNYVNVNIYSNKLEKLLGWRVGQGSKIKQNVSIPTWIKTNPKFCKQCLRGLIETDGSIYKDRGYTMVNFTSAIPSLATDFSLMVEKLGYVCNTQINKPKRGLPKCTVRISRRAKEFIKLTGVEKS